MQNYPYFDSPLDCEKVIEKEKKRFLWLFHRTTIKQRWKVLKTFRFYISRNNWVEVPEGFLTDFASVPRILWSLYPPDDVYTQAAVVHDYLYSIKDRPRKECDDILLLGMEALGVDGLTRTNIYEAVREFGWTHYQA